MGFISNQLEGAFKAGTAHKELAAQLFSYCRDNKDTIGHEGYWMMFSMPNADQAELVKSIKYLPKVNGYHCVQLADVNFYFRTESAAVYPELYIMKESNGLSSSSMDDDYSSSSIEDDEDYEAQERRAASARKAAARRKESGLRAKEQAASIASMPMPERSAIVSEIKESKLYAEQTSKTEKGKTAKMIHDAWMNRHELLIEYGKIHCADDPAFIQLLAEEEAERKRAAELKAQQQEEQKQKLLAKRDELQKHLKPQKIHRWVFWGVYLLAFLIVFFVDDILEEWWEWLLAILAFIAAAIIRAGVHTFFDDDDYDLEKIEEAIKKGKYEDVDVD